MFCWGYDASFMATHHPYIEGGEHIFLGQIWVRSLFMVVSLIVLRVWKPLSSRRILKSWGWQLYITGQNGHYLPAIGLGYYIWYQSQTSSDVLAKTLDPQGTGLWNPTSVREGNETLLIRVWKPLHSRRVLKPWGWRRHITGLSGQYLAVDTHS